MTAPYYPDKTWGESVAEREPRKQDTLAAVLGNRFQQSPQGQPGQPQSPWAQFMPQGGMQPPPGARPSGGAWPQSRQAGSPQPQQVTGAPSGSTPMLGVPALSRVNPFRPQGVAPTLQLGGKGAIGGNDPGATAGGNGYQVHNGVLTGSNYPDDRGHNRNQALPVTYDYSPERSENGYGDISEEQYRELVGLGDQGMENFASYIDPDTGETRYRYYLGANGRSETDLRDEGVYTIGPNGEYLDTHGNPVNVGTNQQGGTPGYMGTHGTTQIGGPMNPFGPTRSSADGFEATPGGPGFSGMNRSGVGYVPGPGGSSGTFDATGGDTFTPPGRTGGGMSLRLGDAPDTLNNARNNNPNAWRPTPQPQVNRTAGLPGYDPSRYNPNQSPTTPSATPPPTNTGPNPGPYNPGPRYNPPPLDGGGPTAGDRQGYGSMPWDSQLDNLIGQGLSNPSRWNDPLVRSTWNSIAGDLDTQFNGLNQDLTARLARQGIRDSTFGGAEQQKLAGIGRDAKSRALQSLEENVANTMANDRSTAIGDALAAAQRRAADQQFGMDYELRKRFGLDDRAYRDRESDWQHGFDTENFNADQQKWMDRFYQWMVEQGQI